MRFSKLSTVGMVAPPVTYNIESSGQYLNEGSTVSIYLTTTGLPNSYQVPYTISGANITVQDFTGLSSLTGNFTINNNTATLVLTAAPDHLTEGNETFRVSLDNTDKYVDVIINDTSLTPGYSLGSSVSNLDEGQSVTITLSTTNVAQGEIIPWTISGANITTSDFTNLSSLTGSFTVDAFGQATLDLTTTADFVTEGPETLTLTLDGKGVSVSVLVNDTSITAPTGQQVFTSTGGTFTFTVPAGCFNISVLCVGKGGLAGADKGSGGGGGGLSYASSISVTPGTNYTIRVGYESGGVAYSTYFNTTSYLYANTGGIAYSGLSSYTAGGGGGAGGYSGTGGRGGEVSFGDQPGGLGGGYGGTASSGGGAGGAGGKSYSGAANTVAGTAGNGGGGGGGSGSYANSGSKGGGGVGLLGAGTGGAGGTATTYPNSGAIKTNQGGSGGAYATSGAGALYGGGAGGYYPGNQPGGNGAVRIIYGTNRAYPSTNTGDM